ncbi:MAG: rRNA maturation RNase YbeY [bacterium]
MKILINDWQKLVKLPAKEPKEIIDVILTNVVKTVLEPDLFKNAVVGITLVDDKTIHDLNKKYRKKDKPTDVLSFYFEKDAGAYCNTPPQGDVVISVETAMRQAGYYKHSFGKELKILLIHGILHLFGYDHIKEKDFEIMRKKEKAIYKIIENPPLIPLPAYRRQVAKGGIGGIEFLTINEQD